MTHKYATYAINNFQLVDCCKPVSICF